MALAFIALGSNLADPILQVKNAFAALSKIPKTRVIKGSSLYRTAPIDCPQSTEESVPGLSTPWLKLKQRFRQKPY